MREKHERKSPTVNTVRTTLVASVSTVPAVCVEGRTNRGARSCVTTVTRPSTSGASLHLFSKCRKKMNGEIHCICIQWNLSNLDTLGTEESVLISEVS